MSEYPIESLMNTAMDSIKEMVDVNTIIGEPIETSNNIVVIPVSKVNFGFAAGGSEFKGKIERKITSKGEKTEKEPEDKIRMPFGGGSGAGVSINPIAFIVVQSSGVKLLPVEHNSSVDKLLDLIPEFADKLSQLIQNKSTKVEKLRNMSCKCATSNNEKNDNKDDIVDTEEKFDYEYDETDM